MASDSENDEDVLKIDDVCRITGLSRPTIRRWIDCGALQAVKRGRCWFVLRRDLAAMFDSMER